jgi:hypothetical protein
VFERRRIYDVQQRRVLLPGPTRQISIHRNAGNYGRTSVNVMISFPPIPELNLTFLTPQPGALFPGVVQSHESSYSQPLAVPIALIPVLPIPPVAPGGERVWSVVKTFIGLRERTSHTATMPS